MIPGWPYSIVAALETGGTSWTALLDAVRLPPAADVTTITCAQIRQLVDRLTDAGSGGLETATSSSSSTPATKPHASPGCCVTFRSKSSAGCAPTGCCAALPRHGSTSRSAVGRPAKHGGEFVFGDPATWDGEQAVTHTDTRLYGQVKAQAWDRLHPRLTRRAAWVDHDGPLPIIAGTVIRLTVDRLPSRGDPKPLWLWWSKVDATAADVDRCWQAFLRRFDIDHTFRLLKQTLGWTAPQLRHPAAADRWTWLVLAAHAQLRLARPSRRTYAGRGNVRCRRNGSLRPGCGGG